MSDVSKSITVYNDPSSDKDGKELVSKSDKLYESKGKVYLRSMLNKLMSIKLSDGRILIGIFLCTDKESNVILGSCAEYHAGQYRNIDQIQGCNVGIEDYIEGSNAPINTIKPRLLGLAMVPGKHIVSIHLDEPLESNYRSTVSQNMLS